MPAFHCDRGRQLVVDCHTVSDGAASVARPVAAQVLQLAVAHGDVARERRVVDGAVDGVCRRAIVEQAGAAADDEALIALHVPRRTDARRDADRSDSRSTVSDTGPCPRETRRWSSCRCSARACRSPAPSSARASDRSADPSRGGWRPRTDTRCSRSRRRRAAAPAQRSTASGRKFELKPYESYCGRM